MECQCTIDLTKGSMSRIPISKYGANQVATLIQNQCNCYNVIKSDHVSGSRVINVKLKNKFSGEEHWITVG